MDEYIDKHFFRSYRRVNTAEMRPYILGEDMADVRIDESEDPMKDMGMIARNPKNHKDQWYVERKYFNDNYEEI